MKYKFLVFIVVMPLIACNKEEETLTGSVIGKVRLDLEYDLSGVKLELENKSYKQETFTDINGLFYFDDLLRDYYIITVSKEGYDTVRHAEIILGNGKPNVIEFFLTRQ